MSNRKSFGILLVFCLIVLVVPGFIFADSPGALKWKLNLGEKKPTATSLSAVEDQIFAIDAGFNWRSSPVIGRDGTIYVGSQDKKFYAVNNDGTVKWIKYVGEQMDGSPSIDKYGNIFIGDDKGTLHAFDPNGNLKWQFQAEGGFFNGINTAPAHGEVIGDDIVFLLSQNNILYALYADDGGLLWQFDAGSGVNYSSPVLGADTTVYFGGDDTFFAVNAETGNLKWTYPVGADFLDYIYTPAVGADGTIYFASSNDTLYALNNDGTWKWGVYASDDFLSGPVIGFDGTIYIGSLNKHLIAISSEGTPLWAFETGGSIQSSPVIASDSTVYVIADDDNLYAFSPDGTLKWKHSEIGIGYHASPTITDNGLLICPGFNLYAIDTGKENGVANTEWPKYCQNNRNTANAAHYNVGTSLGQITLSCGSISATPGSKIQIPINMANPDVSISVGSFYITPLTEGILTFVSFESSNRMDGWNVEYNDWGTFLDVAIYSDQNELIDKGEGTILIANYEINADVASGTEVVVDLSLAEFFDNNEQEVNVELQVGKVNIFDCGMSGDINSDGKVSVFDVLQIVLFSRGAKIPTQQESTCADLTGDGKLDVNDVIACVDIALGKGTLLADITGQSVAEIDMAKLQDGLISLGANQSLMDEINGLVTDAVPGVSLPKAFQLSQNVPNPFNPTTSIAYSVPEDHSEYIDLKVYDVRGRLIKTLVQSHKDAGEYTVFWDGTNEAGEQLASGVYIYRLRAGDYTSTRKMVLLK